MPAERKGWLAEALETLRLLAGRPTDADRLRERISRAQRPKAVRRLDRIAGDLDRLQGRYGDPPPDAESPDGR